MGTTSRSRRCMSAGLCALWIGAGGLISQARAGDPPVKVSPQIETAPEARGVDLLKVEAAKLAGVVESDLARAMLRGVQGLPRIEKRVVHRSEDRSRAFADAALKEYVRLHGETEVTKNLVKKEYDEHFYYFTGYGSPLVYARVLDVLSAHGVSVLDGKRLVDFGYGSIGHLRLLAGMGCMAQGVDVEPVLGALYSASGDQGDVARSDGEKDKPRGRVVVHEGRWPADKALAASQVDGQHDVFTSKNTLKRGYIHPEREVDERYLVKLGVSDDEFVRAVHGALKPGGVFVIYNICPAQNPADKPYLPHADGRCPFPRELLEKAGFDVLAYDQDDTAKVHEIWTTLGYDEGKGAAWLKENLFAMYTVMRRSGGKVGE